MNVAVNARVTAFAIGGKQRVTSEILKRLHDVDMIAPERPLGGAAGHLWEQFVLPLRSRGQLLWSPSATGPIFKARQVVTLHDIAFLDVPEFFSASFRAFYGALIPRLVKRAVRIVTVSEFSRRRIIDRLGLPEDKVVVIPNGVSEGFRIYTSDEIAATRAALNLPPRYVLLQATSDRRKNIHRAFTAWTEAQTVLPDELTLVVFGNQGRSHVFGELGDLSQAPRTRMIGYVAEEHMGPLTAGAEFFLFPSLYEGFGLPTIESMSCGTPVLTSDATATGEVAGGAALLVDPNSTSSIAGGIITLARDAALRRSFREAGLRRAGSFSWDDAARQYEGLFENLTTGRGAPAAA